MEPRSSLEVALQFRQGPTSSGHDPQLAVGVHLAVPMNARRINALIDQCPSGAVEFGLRASSIPDLSRHGIDESRVPERLEVANDFGGAAYGDKASAVAGLSDEIGVRGVKREGIVRRALRVIVLSHGRLLSWTESETGSVTILERAIKLLWRNPFAIELIEQIGSIDLDGIAAISCLNLSRMVVGL